ncbi:hypothetical protein [Streptomyces olivochromogenes]|uniref:hypothetical protein n=1 Tax=Streptomyces olivochromogenes TaxID=1963 RepID=UPI000AF3736D|nr:hypothetical protein [Streptomyces olivochromogenes]
MRVTPFFESVEDMSRSATYGEGVHVAPVLMRSVSTDDIAALAHVALGVPLFGVLEVAGLEEYHLEGKAGRARRPGRTARAPMRATAVTIARGRQPLSPRSRSSGGGAHRCGSL